MNSRTHLGHQAKKRFGQNFLHNDAVISDIVDAINPEPGENLVEIGPGLGALTEPVVERAEKISVVELDRDLAHRLRHHPFLSPHLTIYETDALNFDFAQLAKHEDGSESPLRIFGNLPYNISSQILVKILKFKNLSNNIGDIILMFQKELGEKIIGKFSTKNYGRLSILTNYRLNIIDKFPVSPNCFFPKPKIDSSVLLLKPKIDFFPLTNPKNLEKITRIFFSCAYCFYTNLKCPYYL